jgi:hypothetical protein
VKRFYQERANRVEAPADQVLDAAWLRQLCLDAGADDVGFVECDRPEIADQKADIDNVFSQNENEVVLRIVSALEEVGIGAINGGAVGFPMEADRWGSKMWVISHKPVAVAANRRRVRCPSASSNQVSSKNGTRRGQWRTPQHPCQYWHGPKRSPFLRNKATKSFIYSDN